MARPCPIDIIYLSDFIFIHLTPHILIPPPKSVKNHQCCTGLQPHGAKAFHHTSTHVILRLHYQLLADWCENLRIVWGYVVNLGISLLQMVINGYKWWIECPVVSERYIEIPYDKPKQDKTGTSNRNFDWVNYLCANGDLTLP